MSATPGQAAEVAWTNWYVADRAERTLEQDFNESKYDAMRRAFLAAREPHAADGTWTTAECLERIGDLAGALHEIKQAYAPGTYAHDLAHATLDQRGPEPRPAPGPHRHAFAAADCACPPDCECWRRSLAPRPAPELAARLAVTEAERNDLAAGLDKLKHLLDDFTHAVIFDDDDAELVEAAHAVRAKAGLPIVDDFSRPTGAPS